MSSAGAGPGGYEDGYNGAERLWPTAPGSLVQWLREHTEVSGLRVLDLGAGEGSNAAWLDEQGSRVRAVEISAVALGHARAEYPDTRVEWIQGSVIDEQHDPNSFDLVIAYGLLHCLSREESVELTHRIQRWTRPGGHNIVVAFNDRDQQMSKAHPGFRPTLESHWTYLTRYRDWQLRFATDEDLHETHPHNGIPHKHSMTRIVARKDGAPS